jgi:hypothetical protein
MRAPEMKKAAEESLGGLWSNLLCGSRLAVQPPFPVAGQEIADKRLPVAIHGLK